MIKKILTIKNLKYVICSITSALIELILFYLMTSILFKDTKNILLISTIITRIISATICFIMNKYWCFQVYNKTLIQSIEYTVLFVLKLYLSYFFVNMIVESYQINSTLIKVPVDILLFFLGYVVQNFIIFKKKENIYNN